MNETSLTRNLSSRNWRLCNLYNITNKQGIKIVFQPNWAQKELYNQMHYLNVILKGRQIGLTTFCSILFLDCALFTDNLSLGIIADTEENAKYIFRKIKFAYDCLPDEMKECFKAKVDSAKELTFNNNSVLRVGTSLRSSTFQFLLISEFGKIAAENPKRTNEIITGSLNTVSQGSYVFIESTARGREGAFYEMCVEAQKMRDSKKVLTPMDYKFHFFPWWKHPDYQMQHEFPLGEDMIKYFRELQEIHGISLTAPQRAWYAKKQKEQGDDIFREYPSTSEEAFLANLEGNYYSRHMAKARVEGRITNVSYDANLPVFVSMDLGINDAMALWYFQVLGTEIRLLEYYENSGESLKHYVQHIKSREYVIEKVFAPHDASSRELGSGLTRVQIARDLGLELHVLPRLSIHEGIDAVRNILHRCWFDERKCEKGIRALENYRKEWNELLGTWRDHPRHDHFSNGCFTSDTLIDCSEGNKFIRDIQKGDMVATPNGYKKVLQTFEYEALDLLEVTTTSAKFTCTYNHKIFTARGLIYADELRYNDILYTNSSWSKKLCRNLSKSNVENIGFRENFIFQKMITTSSLKEKNINGQASITGICIGMSGALILEKSSLNTISIIKTAIQEITTSKTYNVLLNPFTYLMPPKKTNGWEVKQINDSSFKPKKKLSYGTQAKKGENGISNKEKIAGTNEKRSRKNANIAAKIMNLGIQDLNFAIIIVKAAHAVIQRLIVKIGNAKFVRNILSLTNTRKKEHVLKIVPVSFNLVQKVYDFEVDEDHCYYANGILVSNSDAFRYLSTSLRKTKSKQDDEEDFRREMAKFQEPQHPLYSPMGGNYY